MQVLFGYLCIHVLGSFLLFDKDSLWAVGDVQCPKQCSCEHNTAICTNSKLKYIPALPNNTTYLDFSGNDLTRIKKTTLSNISTLRIEELILSSCKINVISEDAFSSLTAMTSLDLSRNKLTCRNLEIGLKSLSDSTLTSLRLDSQAKFGKKLPRKLFDSLSKTHLRNLSLTNNSILEFNGTTFPPLQAVEKLNLSGNCLREISFKTITSLAVLDMSKNRLFRLPHLFDKHKNCYFPKLEILILDDNSISYFGKDLNVHCMPHFKHLSAAFNPLRVINDQQFFYIKSLKTLDLSNLHASEIRLENRSFSSDNLQYLRIGTLGHDVDITQGNLKIFENCESLKRLDIRGFSFWKLKDHHLTQLLSPVLNLTSLRIEFANLDRIPSIISEMENLENLSLFNNDIKHWNTDTFLELSQLKYLNIARNKISVINKTSFPERFLKDVETLKMAFNPYACTCDNYWFIHWAKRNIRKVGMHEFNLNFRCSSPSCLSDQPLSMYNPSFIHCYGLELYQTAILSSGVVLFSVLVLSVIYIKYRWHFRYYFYLIRSKKQTETSTLLATETFKYDAFVAYTSEDRSWVISNLMAVLEGEHNFSLCLHERDFLPGRTILDQISETIKHSRKVILVLSTNFAKSLWCQYEILLARNKLMEDGGNALIVILLDEVKDKYMTNCLGMLLRTMTYIKWTSSSEGRKLFWNKVIMSLKA